MNKKGIIGFLMVVCVLLGAGGYWTWHYHNDVHNKQEKRISKNEKELSSLRKEISKKQTEASETKKSEKITSSVSGSVQKQETSASSSSDVSSAEATSSSNATNAPLTKGEIDQMLTTQRSMPIGGSDDVLQGSITETKTDGTVVYSIAGSAGGSRMTLMMTPNADNTVSVTQENRYSYSPDVETESYVLTRP